MPTTQTITLSGTPATPSNTSTVTATPAAAPLAAPPTPAFLLADFVRATSVKVSWQATSTQILGYVVSRSITQNGTYTDLGRTEDTEYVDKTVQPVTNYFFKVRARNSVGESAPTAALPVTTRALGNNSATFTANSFDALIYRFPVGGDADSGNHPYDLATNTGWFIRDFLTYEQANPATTGRVDFVIAVANADNGNLYLWDGRVLKPTGEPVRGGGAWQDGVVDSLILANAAVTAAKLATGAVSGAAIAAGAVGIGAFAAGLRPNEILSVLPAGDNTGRIALYTVDGKLYRGTATGWTAAVPAVDLTGQITNTQISDNAIDTPNLRAGSVVAGTLAAGSVVAGKLAVDAVTAGTIAAAAINTRELAAQAVTASKLTVGNFDNLAEDPNFSRGGLWIASNFIIVDDSTNSHSGTYCAKLTQPEGLISNNLIVDCKPGDKFYVEGWLKVTGSPAIAAVRISLLDRNQVEAQNLLLNNVASDNVYHLSNGAFTVPQGISYLRAQFYIYGGTANACYVDDMYLRRVVDGAIIADAAIITAKIADAAITSAKIANAAIGTAQIGNAVILSANIGIGQILTANIGDAQINNAKIGLLAVDNANIAAAAITTAKIADLSVTTAKVYDAAITNAKIANLAVDSAKIANLSVLRGHIVDAAIDRTKIQDAEIVSAKIANASIDIAKVSSLTSTNFIDQATGYRLLPNGSAQLNEGVLIGHTRVIAISERATVPIDQDGRWRGPDTGVPNWNYLTAIQFFPSIYGSNGVVMTALGLQFDGYDSAIANNLSSADFVEVRIYNYDGALIAAADYPWAGRGVVGPIIHSFNRANPASEAIYSLQIHNNFGYSSLLYVNNGSWGFAVPTPTPSPAPPTVTPPPPPTDPPTPPTPPPPAYVPPPDPDTDRCVLPDTPMLCVSDGVQFWKRAEDVTTDDTFIAIAPDGSVRNTGIRAIMQGWTNRYFSIHTENGKFLQCSASHPIIRRFGDLTGVPARAIEKGAGLVTYTENEERAEESRVLEFEEIIEPSLVYTFSLLDSSHTHVSGGIVTHNVIYKS